MSSLHQLSKVEFDFSGNTHLICVEDRAIDVLVNNLENLEHILESIQILQLGKTKIKQDNLNVKQFNTLKKLQDKLTKILDRATIGMRFYALGSEQFVWNLRVCARSFGLSESEINLNAIGSEAKNIYCSNCQTINHFVKDNISTCFNCGIKLEVVEHFSRLKNAYLGICVDAEN